MPQSYKGAMIPLYSEPADGPKAFTDFIDGGGAISVCTTATRPSAPNIGHTIYNTSVHRHEVWSGSEWKRVVGPETLATPTVTKVNGPTMAFTDRVAVRAGGMVTVAWKAEVTATTTGFVHWTLTGAPTPLIPNFVGQAWFQAASGQVGGTGRIPMTLLCTVVGSTINVRASFVLGAPTGVAVGDSVWSTIQYPAL